jgi:hypothetical protein
MSCWSRRRLSAIAIALLVAIAALSVPHEAQRGHESEFAGFVAGDGSDGVFSTENPDAGHQFHCLACHWARAFRPAVEARYLASPADNGRIARSAGVARGDYRLPVSQPSLRAPPVATLPPVHA